VAAGECDETLSRQRIREAVPSLSDLQSYRLDRTPND